MTSSPYATNDKTIERRLPPNRRRPRVALSQRQRVVCAYVSPRLSTETLFLITVATWLTMSGAINAIFVG